MGGPKRGPHNRTTPSENDRIREAKKLVQEEARIKLHPKLDQPDAYGNGGNSDTGVVADKLWKNTEVFAEFFGFKDEDKKAKIEDVLLRLSVILGAINSSRRMEKMEEFQVIRKTDPPNAKKRYPSSFFILKN